MKVSGRASYLVTPAGTIDLPSIEISDPIGISPQGFASAARRYLATCTFQVPPGLATPVRVSQTLRFAAGDHWERSTIPKDWADKHPELGTLYRLTEVEEVPYLLACAPMVVGDPTLPGRQRTLRARYAFVIDTAGRVEADQIRFLDRKTSAEVQQDLPGLLAGCRYLPARLRGEPVRVLLASAMGWGVDWHPTRAN
jgi:hypothetical protein